MNKELFENKCIMVVGAMQDAELDFLINNLKNVITEKESIYTFYIGNMFEKKVVVCVSKIGTINAACATTLGIIRYKPKCIISIGIAGGYGKNVRTRFHRGKYFDAEIERETFKFCNRNGRYIFFWYCALWENC